jgi:MraZ protein
MLLTGTFGRAVDEKLRVAIPKPLREALGTLAKGVLYVAPGTDGSLAIYTEEALAELARRLQQASPNAQDVRAFSRLFYARAQAVELDSQGRMRIPPELAALTGLAKEAVLVGVQDHLELWERGRWEQYVAQRQDQYDQIAEAAFQHPSGRSIVRRHRNWHKAWSIPRSSLLVCPSGVRSLLVRAGRSVSGHRLTAKGSASPRQGMLPGFAIVSGAKC